MNEPVDIIIPHSSFPDLHLASLIKEQGRSLPRWEATNAIYHIAFHLADSVPTMQLELWKEARASLTNIDDLRAAYSEHVERYLSAGHGECLLRDRAVADAVASVLLHDNGTQYALHEYVIMPNHCHLIVGQLRNDIHLKDLIASWKRITSHRVNALTGHNGGIWHRDAYTRIIRDAEEYRHQLSYVWNNPELAGLTDGFLRARFV